MKAYILASVWLSCVTDGPVTMQTELFTDLGDVQKAVGSKIGQIAYFAACLPVNIDGAGEFTDIAEVRRILQDNKIFFCILSGEERISLFEKNGLTHNDLKDEAPTGFDYVETSEILGAGEYFTQCSLDELSLLTYGRRYEEFSRLGFFCFGLSCIGETVTFDETKDLHDYLTDRKSRLLDYYQNLPKTALYSTVEGGFVDTVYQIENSGELLLNRHRNVGREEGIPDVFFEIISSVEAYAGYPALSGLEPSQYYS